MSFQNNRLTNILYPTTGSGILFTNSATKTFLKGFLSHNTQTSQTTFQMFFVTTSGETAATENRIFQYALDAGETALIDFPYTFIMSGENTLRASSSVQSGINVILFGDTI